MSYDPYKNEAIDRLAERLSYLEDEMQFTLDALRMAVSIGMNRKSLNQLECPETLIANADEQVRKLILFKRTAFFLIDERDSDFFLADVNPMMDASMLMDEVDPLIDDGTFARAIHTKEPVLTYSRAGDPILLHSVTTISRTRGMFVGFPEQYIRDIREASYLLLSVVISQLANNLESFELYGRIRKKNENLDQELKEVGEKQAEQEKDLKGKYKLIAHTLRTAKTCLKEIQNNLSGEMRIHNLDSSICISEVKPTSTYPRNTMICGNNAARRKWIGLIKNQHVIEKLLKDIETGFSILKRKK